MTDFSTDWVSTIGATGDILVMALSDENGLIDVGSMTNEGGSGAPQLRMRRQNSSTVLSFDVTEYTDDNDPARYNAQVQFSFDDITPGVWLAQVVGEIDGQVYRFPRDSYQRLKFIAGT